jgi:ABC-type Fe3+-hydroxamate transport system substrate-binding protein
MKKSIVTLACMLVAPLAFAQTSTTTSEQRTSTQPTRTTETTATSTSASGTVTTYAPRKRIVVKSESGNPVSYVLGKTVHYVNKTGREVDEHLIRPGKRVIVHYTGVGEKRRVERIEVED